jgi:hypothetical protein
MILHLKQGCPECTKLNLELNTSGLTLPEWKVERLPPSSALEAPLLHVDLEVIKGTTSILAYLYANEGKMVSNDAELVSKGEVCSVCAEYIDPPRGCPATCEECKRDGYKGDEAE